MSQLKVKIKRKCYKTIYLQIYIYIYLFKNIKCGHAWALTEIRSWLQNEDIHKRLAPKLSIIHNRKKTITITFK